MKTHFLRIRGLVPVMVGAWTALAGLVWTAPASAQTDRLGNLLRSEFSRPRTVTGLGLVTGLDGTGDTGRNLASARLYAEMLRRSGAVDETDLPQDVLKAGGIALVTVTATIQIVEQGGRYVPCSVSIAGGGATSLAGGRLWVTPLRDNPTMLFDVDPEDLPRPVAFAQGPLIVDEDAPTIATIDGPSQGAFVVPTSGIDESTQRYQDFYDNPYYRGRREVLFDFRNPTHGTITNAQRIVDAINEELMEDGFTDLASIASEDGVLVRLPDVERDAFRFAARIENIPVEFARVIEVPARIDWDPAAGVLSITGNTRLLDAHVSIDGFQLSRVEPRREPTLENPDITLEAGVILSGRETPPLMLREFQRQLDKLQVPAQKQADVLRLLCEQGMVQAEFHVTGVR